MKSSFAEYNISQQQLASAAIFKELYFERTAFLKTLSPTECHGQILIFIWCSYVWAEKAL